MCTLTHTHTHGGGGGGVGVEWASDVSSGDVAVSVSGSVSQ